ncbi:hypothetical protein E2C01_016066 [Portunus trituberculatus]|uniref:HTH psq-type domain-containing protein n=1 Tax=Portunus trituberculatus TaxID=210409 RepID=A0A5B7DN40_PORTR|nr:hypothetical protein [Portunus trituberculatus]
MLRKATSSPSPKKHNFLPFKDKLELIRKCEADIAHSVVAVQMGVPRSTVSIIWKNRDKYNGTMCALGSERSPNAWALWVQEDQVGLADPLFQEFQHDPQGQGGLSPPLFLVAQVDQEHLDQVNQVDLGGLCLLEVLLNLVHLVNLVYHPALVTQQDRKAHAINARVSRCPRKTRITLRTLHTSATIKTRESFWSLLASWTRITFATFLAWYTRHTTQPRKSLVSRLAG